MRSARCTDIDPLPEKGAKIDEFTVVSNINQEYGIYGYCTAMKIL